MSTLLLIASSLTVLLGIIHSALGHKLIFIDEAETLALLHARKRGIIWATWHLASLLAFGIAAILIWLSQNPDLIPEAKAGLYILTVCLFVSAALVNIGTKGKHPGWIVLSMIAGLILFAAVTSA